MKKITVFMVSFFVAILDAHAAMDHSAHRGGGRAETGGATCVRPSVSKMLPAPLTTVAPGSEFSFIVSNIADPSHISVEVKKQTIEITSEFKDPYYIIRGKIPPSLTNTAARVDVKIDAKITSCRMAEGWLLKISGN